MIGIMVVSILLLWGVLAFRFLRGNKNCCSCGKKDSLGCIYCSEKDE